VAEYQRPSLAIVVDRTERGPSLRAEVALATDGGTVCHVWRIRIVGSTEGPRDAEEAIARNR